MKRPAYLQNLVDRANAMFRHEGMKDYNNNDLFAVVCDILLEKNCYKGFNFYKKFNLNGREVYRLSGNSKQFDCIQIW